MDITPAFEADILRSNRGGGTGALALYQHINGIERSSSMRTFAEGTLRDFRRLQNGSHLNRLAEGDSLLLRLLPEGERGKLGKRGIFCYAWHETNKTNPKLTFRFAPCGGGEALRWVVCDIGKRVLETEKGEEGLFSLRQVRRKIQEAVHALSH